jgi:hypothetical protein
MPVRAGATEGEGVPLTAFAKAVQLSYTVIFGGLMAPTIPAPQWDDGVVISQKYQIGALILVTCRFQVFTSALGSPRVPTAPLLNPPGRGRQGLSKVL